MDSDKWSAKESYDVSWIERGRLALEITQIKKGKIFEFGVGPRLGVSSLLESEVVYIPSDRYAWTPRVVVVDLDKQGWETHEVFLENAFDYGILLGVLEYVSNPLSFFKVARSLFPALIFSFCTRNLGADVLQRRRVGWLQDFTLIEMITMLNEENWMINTVKLYEDFPDFRQYIFYVSTGK